MDDDSRINWIIFIAVFAVIISLALSINIYRLLSKDKEPPAAFSVMHNTLINGKYY